MAVGKGGVVPPDPAIYQLLGYPGTGKYTVAREIVHQLCAAGREARLLDNHRTANLVWDLVPAEHRFDPEVMTRIRSVRRTVLDTIAAHSPRDWSFVFTNWVPAHESATVLEPHRQLALERRVPMVAVVLECELDELLRRVVRPDRAERLKLVDPDRTRTIVDRGMSLPDWPGLRRLDVTHLTPEEAAARVIAG